MGATRKRQRRYLSPLRLFERRRATYTITLCIACKTVMLQADTHPPLRFS